MRTVLEEAFAVVRQWLIANWHIAHIVFFLFAYSFCPIVTYQQSSSLGNVGCTTSESVRYLKKNLSQSAIESRVWIPPLRVASR